MVVFSEESEALCAGIRLKRVYSAIRRAKRRSNISRDDTLQELKDQMTIGGNKPIAGNSSGSNLWEGLVEGGSETDHVDIEDTCATQWGTPISDHTFRSDLTTADRFCSFIVCWVSRQLCLLKACGLILARVLYVY